MARTIRTKGVAYTENVDVDVVQVTATVTDDDGRFVRGLTRQDFRLYEDDVPQALTTFFSENVPLELIVGRRRQRQHDGRDAEGEGVGEAVPDRDPADRPRHRARLQRQRLHAGPADGRPGRRA